MRFLAAIIVLATLWWPILPPGAADVLVQSMDGRPVEASRPTEATHSIAEIPQPALPRPATDDAIQDLVYLASDRPVFIRLNIRVLGEGFRGLRAEYARRLQQSLDEDGDGLLNEAEMRNIPPSDQLLPPRGPQEELRLFNTDPVDADGNGVVTLQELTDYVRKSTGRPFDFKMAPPSHAGQVDVFEVVDENSDGILDGDEIRSASHAILKFDANVDEIVDQSELSIDGRRHAAGGPSAGESMELLSLLVVVDPETDGAVDALFAQLVERYDGPPAPAAQSSEVSAHVGRLDASELGMSPDRFARWDTNGDGVLEVHEGRLLVLDPVPDLELTASLGSGVRASVASTAFLPTDDRATEFAAAPGQRRHLQLTMGDERFDLSMGASPAPYADLRRKFDKNFDTADGDGNEYLDMTEIRQLGILPAQYSAVDRDGNRMVRKEELLEYVELQALLFSSRVVLLLSREAQSILDLIDEGADDQLGLRELRQAPTRILTWDLNGDGRIEPDERPANSRLIVQNGETMLFRGDQFRSSRHRNMANRSASGPLWFRKMDRNRDGDLSPREFLGPIETFKRLDQNADGLLSDTEVLKVD